MTKHSSPCWHMERFRLEHDKEYYNKHEGLILDDVPKEHGSVGTIECLEHKEKLVCILTEYGYYVFEQIPDTKFRLCEHLIEYKTFIEKHEYITLNTEGYRESISCNKCDIVVDWPTFTEILNV